MQKTRISKVTVSLSQALTTDDLVEVILKLINNKEQIIIDEIELSILGAPDLAGTQRTINSVATSIEQGSAELQDVIDKEKKS